MIMKSVEARGLKFHCRTGSSDEKAVQEVVMAKAYERRDFQIEAGERWLDLGGNVGAFSVLAASRGAHVVTFEPDPDNVKLIRSNLALNSLTADVRARAIVHDDRKAVTLNLWPKGQSWRNSIVRNKKGTQGITVLCENFFKVVQHNDCVKMDIEGAEIALLEAWPRNFPVKKLVFEYSFDVDPSVARLRAIIANLKTSFGHVRYSSQIDRIENWNFFPPATMVHCWN